MYVYEQQVLLSGSGLCVYYAPVPFVDPNTMGDIGLFSAVI